MHSKPRRRCAYVVLVLLLALAGCRPVWQAEVQGPQGAAVPVDRHTLQALSAHREEAGGASLVPLERVLAGAGAGAIERLVAVEPGGACHEYRWAEVAGRSWWLDSGRLRIGEDEFAVARVEAEPPELAARAEASIIDVAPGVAAALGLPAPAEATGRPLAMPTAERAAIVVLDGLGYRQYEEALQAGRIPNLAALGTPLVALTVYPPVTVVATASLLTGAPPAVHGVDRRGIRSTEAETLFDVVAQAGRRVVAVEGESLAFNLRNAELKLSGDRSGDGHTDDEVLANALAIVAEGLPDLLFVHWHGIDDAGHSYGPASDEFVARIEAVDAAVGELIAALPDDTLVVILADHGMHDVVEEGRAGNHGHLIEEDMFVPILVARTRAAQ